MEDESGVYVDTVNLLLARIAQDEGLLTPKQVDEALAAQNADQEQGVSPVRALSFILVEKRFISNTQLVSLLRKLRDRERDPDRKTSQETLLGALLLRNQSVTPPQLAECLRIQESARAADQAVVPRLGELLVKQGYTPATAMAEALAAQAEARTAPIQETPLPSRAQ